MFSFLSSKRKRCEETQLDNLPDEIIHKVLTLLDPNSVKACAAVNKRFSEIVATSSILLKCFKLKLSGDFWKNKWKIMEAISLRRKVLEIEITNAVGGHDILVRVFKNLGSHVRTLTINDSKIDDFTLKEMLRYADSLANLVLSEVTIIKKLPAINPVSMRKLENLTINHCDWTIIRFIKAQLQCLLLKSYLDEGQKCHMVSFLVQQYQLRELTLRGTSSKFLFMQDDIVTDCNFALEKFHLEHYFGKNSENVNWHITAFLSLHTETLENVEISGPHCEHLNGFAIANMDNLKSLSIDVRGLPKDEEFYDLLVQEPNMQLKELSLRGFFVQYDCIRRILLKYPALERLELNDWGNGALLPEMLETISQNFPHLQQLSITEITNTGNIKFAALKNLRVTFVKNSSKLVQFMIKNSSIETLKVGLVYIEQITSDFVDDLQALKNVKHLSFGGNGKALTAILELMKKCDSTGTLQSLELSLVTSDTLTASSSSKKFFFPIGHAVKFDLIL